MSVCLHHCAGRQRAHFTCLLHTDHPAPPLCEDSCRATDVWPQHPAGAQFPPFSPPQQAQLASREEEYNHLAQEVHTYSAHHSVQELETLRTQVS